MHPDKVRRDSLSRLTYLPNIGVSLAQDLAAIGIACPADLYGKSALELYEVETLKHSFPTFKAA